MAEIKEIIDRISWASNMGLELSKLKSAVRCRILRTFCVMPKFVSLTWETCVKGK